MNGLLLPLVLAVAMGAQGDPTPEELLSPGEVLRRARTAIDRAKTLGYVFDYEGTGTLAGKFRGSMLIRRPWKGDRARLRTTIVDRSSGDLQKPDARLILASDGQHVQRFNLDAGSFVQGSLNEGASKLLVTAYYGIPLEILTDAPLDGGQRGSQLRYLGTEIVDDIVCHLVEVATPVPGGRTVVGWYISMKDYLPRRQTWENDIPEAPGKMRLDLKDVKVDGLVDPSVFRLQPAAGVAEAAFDGPVIKVGAPAPSFRLQTPEGEWVSSEDLRGKVTVLTFWASWCPRCRLLKDGLAGLAVEMGDRPLAIVGINAWERDPEAPRTFLKQHPAAYPVLLEGDPVAEAFGVPRLPGLYVIGKDGRFLAVDDGVGTSDLDALRALLEQALGGAADTPPSR